MKRQKQILWFKGEIVTRREAFLMLCKGLWAFSTLQKLPESSYICRFNVSMSYLTHKCLLWKDMLPGNSFNMVQLIFLHFQNDVLFISCLPLLMCVGTPSLSVSNATVWVWTSPFASRLHVPLFTINTYTHSQIPAMGWANSHHCELLCVIPKMSLAFKIVV